MKRIIVFFVFFSFFSFAFAQQSYELKDIKAGIESKIDSWCSKYPLEHIALNSLGYCYLQEKNFEEVDAILREKFKEGFVDDLEKFTTYFLLGISKTRFGDNKKAADAFVQLKALAQDLNGAKIYEAIGSLAKENNNPVIDKDVINKHLEQVEQFVNKKENEINSRDTVLAYVKGQRSEVIEQTDRPIASSNSVAQSFYEGKIALKNNDFEVAIKSYDFSIVMGYTPADIYLDMAYAYNQLGRYEEAVRVLTDFLKRDPLYGKSCALRLLEEAKEKVNN